MVPKLTHGLLLAMLATLQVRASPSVNVRMQAAFPAGSYLLELLETAAAENSSAYFPLLDRIASGHFSQYSTESSLYDQFIDVLREDGHLKSSDTLSTFNLALSLRSSAPRVEAHYQYYETAVASGKIDGSCESWVLLDGDQYCTPQLEGATRAGVLKSAASLLPFDRSIGLGREAILYANPTSPSFGDFHTRLSAAAQAGQLNYRLRYRRPKNNHTKPLSISGYGVELALKKTDYIVIDDREAQEHDDGRQNPLNMEAIFEEQELTNIRPLSTSELASLGMKTASFVQSSADPFRTLVKLMQDFPKFSSSISVHNVSEKFSKEYRQARMQRVPRGINALWMNGMRLNEHQMEPFALLEMLRRERRLIDATRDLGFTSTEAISLLGHENIAKANADAEDAIRYDWTDQFEDGQAIAWLNNLEEDALYDQYPSELQSLLQPTHPGQILPIAKNIFHVASAIDFSDINDLNLILQLTDLIDRGVPVRFGIVPSGSSTEALRRTKVFFHLLEVHGLEVIQRLLVSLVEKSSSDSNEADLVRIIKNMKPLEGAKEQDLVQMMETEKYDSRLEMAQKWTTRLKASDKAAPVIFVNGVSMPRTGNWLQRMSMQVSKDFQMVQDGVYHNLIHEDTSMVRLFLEKALKHRNMYISPDDSRPPRFLHASKLYEDHQDLFGAIPVKASDLNTAKESWAAVTVVADMTTADGRDLILAAIRFRQIHPGVQLSLIHNPVNTTKASETNDALKARADLFDARTIEAIEKIVKSSREASIIGNYSLSLARFLKYVKVQPGNSMIILNGRIIGPIMAKPQFSEDDFEQFLEFEQRNRIFPLYEALEKLNISKHISNPISAAKLSSITALSTMSDLPEGIFESTSSVRSLLYLNWDARHTTIEVGDSKTASIHLVALLNPLSEQAQRCAPLLKVLSELHGIYLKIFLNPKEKLDELPIKRFFRYVLEAKPKFDANGAPRGTEASFTGIPSEALLTLGMDVPPAWLVAAKYSSQDLDNIRLSSTKSSIDATYELEHILIQGHSKEGKSIAPRGAQLVLGTEKEPHLTDTIIMANLGFFQFKANPGIYDIHLKEGRSANIYEIESVGAQGWTAVPGDEGTSLALIDFQGTTLYPRLIRKPGMEQVDVLGDSDIPNAGFVSKGFKLAEELLGNALGKKSASDLEHAEINIFSVASGHLYERMLNIMMVSVMRHTKHTVKFWFIEQFLSPSFKDFIPHLAKEYGFKYEMVTYKWPHWLRPQKEKQREIWGYKILFLDVLFPLSVDKVIFVDADQIVRTDMMDLVKLDLEGAPYGFTPMCDSRTEMEGFRFWKQGYWANYLRGRPYHISALYVVDLQRFRAMAAGDRLRQQYQALSADPNSLANLDQDLPNHMQFQLPIHSLPQEWLWCETWCSDESLSRARTIDLCNNPQTKEPKLDRARRQVPEWTAYDDEIAALAKRVKATEVEAESVSRETADVNTKSRRFEEVVHTKDEL